jgi:2-dehydropantoate 2-reductase
MRIAVIGAGGLGGYFGARLCLGGADVHFVARGRHLQALREQGLRVVGPEPMHVPRVDATDDAGSIGTADLVMLCVKLWDTAAALEQIRPLVGAQTAIVSFQNGVLKDQALKDAFGAGRVMGGVGYVAAAIDEPGTTTTMRKPIGPIREHAQTRAFLLDVMREVVAVGRAHGVNLPEDYAEVRLKLADDVAHGMTSSMHHDLERGNPLEVRWLAGAVVELGGRKGVPTPLNRAIADILALHAAGAAS